MPTKVLVIDDDFSMTRLLKLILEDAGFEVATANGGQEGLDLLPGFDPAVLILDLMMPIMNGWQVCAAVRAFSDVPILIFTALDNMQLVIQAIDYGADDYLIKPVSYDDLITHLKKLIQRRVLNAKNSPAQPGVPPAA